jgi:asparagine synthase (glutamine-hydrolysing)
MCGVAGFWLRSAFVEETARAMLGGMTDALRHRGPDDAGTWIDGSAKLALGHRRLSILDLSVEGHQPMTSASGRWVISYNGEIYNFAALRRELEQAGEAPALRGHSDTEVMLACFDAWGLEASVRRFIGMFAFALWDRRDRVLHLVRDRLGIKPLYVGSLPSGVVFGSELKALTAVPDFDREIDRVALAAYVQTSYVPAPLSIYRAARKVKPGTILSLSAASLDEHRETEFWSAVEIARAGLATPFAGDEREAVDELERALKDAIALRMIADVPLGAFLSGGIDSSTVVALMQAQSTQPVRTFSIGNETAYYDEAAAAAKVAEHLGTQHTSIVVTSKHALEVIPRLPEMYDEPFADSSQIPTFLVSELARREVTVALSGDGGDELFGGYNRHVWGPRVWRVIDTIPAALRHAAARGLYGLRPEMWDRVFDTLAPVLPRIRRPGQQVHRLASVLGVDSLAALYDALSSYWEPELVRGGRRLTDRFRLPIVLGDAAAEFMLLDLITYLPDDILAKVDRASMAVSLEARVPILDHRVAELAWRLPHKLKVRDGKGKWLLRQLLARYVPDALVERPKMGFIIPVGEWLRGPLRGWAEDLLEPRRLQAAGFFDPAPIEQRLREHLSGARDWGEHLWPILVFEQWRDHPRSEEHAAAA